MSNVHDAGKPGQGTNPSSTTEELLSIILEEIRKLGARLESVEGRLEHLDAPDSVRPPLIPPLALRSDGKVLLSVAHVKGADLAGRETWEGIILSKTEAADVFKAMSEAADDAAGHTAGHILWHGKDRDNDPDEGSGDGQQ
jgi:hypothetical protein